MTMDELDIKIKSLIGTLEEQGANTEELEYWRSIADVLTPEQQQELLATLEAESIELLKIKNNGQISEEEKTKLQKDSTLLDSIEKQQEEEDKKLEEAYSQKRIKELKDAIQRNN